MRVQRVVGSKGVDVKTSPERYKVWDSKGFFLGSLYVNQARLVWCGRRIQPVNGIRIGWEDFIEYMNERDKQ